MRMSRARVLIVAMVATVAMALVLAGFGCRTASHAGIAPDAHEPLRRMSDLLAAADSFHFHAPGMIEEELASGQVVMVGYDADILVRRPDRLRMHVRRGPESYRIWHQGKALTILDERRNLYAVVETPTRIGQMLDFMADEYDMVFPLADLLYPDPYEVLTEQVTSGTYVGEQMLDAGRCHHLLFTQDNVDWQIWIAAGEHPVPRKVVITYKGEDHAPQYEGVLKEWRLVKTEDKDFVPALPREARQVDVDELLDAAE